MKQQKENLRSDVWSILQHFSCYWVAGTRTQALAVKSQYFVLIWHLCSLYCLRGWAVDHWPPPPAPTLSLTMGHRWDGHQSQAWVGNLLTFPGQPTTAFDRISTHAPQSSPINLTNTPLLSPFYNDLIYFMGRTNSDFSFGYEHRIWHWIGTFIYFSMEGRNIIRIGFSIKGNIDPILLTSWCSQR